MTTTVDPKGNVPLPEEILRDSGVHPGDRLDVFSEGEDIVLRKPKGTPVDSLLDILHGLKELPLVGRNRSAVRNVQL
jgi:AbrB family looped-hinge helix DNA binding protein